MGVVNAGQGLGLGRSASTRRRLALAAGGVLALTLTLSACGGAAPTPGATVTPATSASPTSTPKASSTPTAVQPTKDQVTVAITIAGGQVTPNGDKIDVALGSKVVLNVTSDADDEIHAHTGGDGYELEVKAGEPTSGTFTANTPGSFEVESHHLEKIIVILNVR